MRSFVVVSTRVALFLLGTVLFAAGSFPSGVSAESEVTAQVCGGSASSTVAITSPSSGDTITTIPVSISGTVSRASQIDIMVDGVYDSTVPVGATQTDFIADIMLSKGTHEIRFVANDRCHVENGVAVLTLTYAPPVVPDDEDPTDTNTNSGEGGSSDVGSGVQVTPDSPSKSGSSGNKSPLAVLIEPIQSIAAVLDVDSTLKDGAPQGALRVSLIVSGAFMASLGSASYVSLLEFFKQAARATKVKKYFATHHVLRESAFRFGGLALFVFAFLI